MQDNGVILLTSSRKEPWHVDERNNRNIKSVTETYKTCTFARCVCVKHTSISSRLISHNTYALTIKPGESSNDVLCKFRLNFKELPIIRKCCNHFVHVISLIRIIWYYLIKQILFPVDGIGALDSWCFFHVVWRNVTEQSLNHFHCLFFSLRGEMSHTTLWSMYAGTT